MKANAVIYCSKTGHTAKFAELLAGKTGLPCWSVEEAPEHVKKGEKVVFLGWLFAGYVRGYRKARRSYDVVLTAGVGMKPPNDKDRARLANQNGIRFADFRLLLGGFDMTKLTGLDRLIMTAITNSLKKKLGKKEILTDDEKLLLSVATNNLDCVSEDKLEDIVAVLERPE